MSKYDKLLVITASAVEALVELAPAVDATATVNRALKVEPQIWEYLSKDVVETLAQVYGLYQPGNAVDAGEARGEVGE